MFCSVYDRQLRAQYFLRYCLSGLVESVVSWQLRSKEGCLRVFPILSHTLQSIVVLAFVFRGCVWQDRLEIESEKSRSEYTGTVPLIKAGYRS